jgi:hypothetical protein
LRPAGLVHGMDKTWSFLLSIKNAHDLAVAINDLQTADDYGSVHAAVSLKRKRASLANSWCTMSGEAQIRAASSAPAFAAMRVLKDVTLFFRFDEQRHPV